VLHDQEVTYSVVLPLTLTDGPGTLTEHYHLIGVALAAALHRLGLPVQLVRPQVRGAGPRPPATAACFAALSRYELSVDGKKLVGSAQKRGQSSLLQHGSIPLWMDRHRLFQCLRVPPEQYDHLVQAAYQTMTAVNELTANPLRPEAVHAALRHSFAATCGVELVEGALQPEEWRLAQQLQRTKYASADWNIGGAAAWRAAAVASEPTPTVGGYQRA
jgi:lipoate-protein ligase A